jgi:hypothetical protein
MHTTVIDTDRYTLLRTGLLGTVVKEAKKDQSGSIQTKLNTSYQELELLVQKCLKFDANLIDALQDFIESPLDEIVLSLQTSSQR